MPFLSCQRISYVVGGERPQKYNDLSEMRTPITYYGGKQTMLKHILPLIPSHTLYTEPFCGGAAVFFAKEPSDGEVINDLNQQMTNFYEVLKTDYDILKARIEVTVHSRDMHAHAAHILEYPQFFTRMDRAWAVWALSKMSFASMLDGTFGYDFGGGMPKKLRNAKAEFGEHLSQRLDNVTIENRDALEVIRCYDSPDAFHFVDPPYVGSDCGHYEGVFGESHLLALLDLLAEVKGKFMLTMFPDDNIERYATVHGWHIHRIERTISASKTSRRKQEEWMVCNYVKEEEPTLFD